ncbi:MAG TPA: NADH dehydrogenase subunit [Firmicutes bacterium]|uniref:Nickel-dependent hydrogenase large subunit n=1 Tax=Candidatus Fermentithermobacillus carboniphilus TaxID=3085328 RepID=A0AAT9L9I7_9FIRM|nr:MAG: nickel-dependent hydrogenase large subunit [Candidatus Fermentithermobacillus carboniphilus]HHW18400.1 NADH dehydrogenase subunit [Candidatus Fermentithermobacillaceae bacterium]
MPEIEIPVGPQHPALKEPESFRFEVDGEIVKSVDIRLGYVHRGIEKACQDRTWVQAVYLIERICGICSHSHTTCFCQAVEEIAGIEVPRRARFIRSLFGEMERIHSHLLWLGLAGHEVGFDSLFMYAWHDREIILDALESISGNRVNYGMNTIGGVRRDVTEKDVDELGRALDLLEERVKYYTDVALNEATFRSRLEGVGKITREQAIDLGTVGPTARSAGVDVDLRRDDPYAAYDEIPFRVITADGGDLLAAAVVRLGEIEESLKIIRYIIENLPDGPIAVKAPRRIPAGEACSRYEAPRGEDIHYVRSGGGDKPLRVKVRAPTLANINAVAQSMRGARVADIPIIIAGIDPCFSCTDRMVRLDDVSSGRTEVLTWAQLSARCRASR